MEGPVLSDNWYRVAQLKPRLRAHALVHRHRYRGQLWFVIQDPAAGRVHRITPAARLIVAAMDGERTMDRLWELANRRFGEEAPTQDELIQLMGQLHAADLLQTEVTPDVEELFERGRKQQTAKRWRNFMNPMSVRLSLLDPDAFLNRRLSLIRLLWSRWGALLWLAVVTPALVLLPPHWGELTSNLSDRVLAADNLVALAALYVIVKAWHELGHAVATKAGGGEVHDMGVIFLVLMPVPYVDASAAGAFRSKAQRALVGAAGMLAELFLAAIALYVWLLAEPGLARALAFNAMFVAGVSTLIFNGNPLLRYDAYYILADLIEMPNLAQRAVRYIGYLIQRYAFGARDLELPQLERGERTWLVVYGIGSFVYRTIVTVAIVLFIAGQFFVVGVVLAAWSVVAMVIVPIGKIAKHLATSPQLRKKRARAYGVTWGFVIGALIFLLAVPVPSHTVAEGVVWLPERSMVRAEAGGFVDRVLVESGRPVGLNEPLVESFDPALNAQILVGEAKVAELEATYAAQFVNDRNQSNLTRDQLAKERLDLARARERAAGLIVGSQTRGAFLMPRPQDQPGRFVRKGDLLGYVIERSPPVVRVIVAQDEVDLVRQATRRVDVRLAHRLSDVLQATIVREVPAGAEELPSRALAIEGGGHVALDPREPKANKALNRLFQFDIEFADSGDATLFGERAYVRFSHEHEPLARQWYRAVRQLFLSRFDV